MLLDGFVNLRGPVSLSNPAATLDGDRVRLEAVVYDELADRGTPVGLTAEALERVAAAFAGLPVLDRRHEAEENPGKVIGKVISCRVEGTKLIQVQEWFDPVVVNEVREGIRQGFSISWDPTSSTVLVCSTCKAELGTCDHKPGVEGCRAQFTDAIPLEVTRTYAPVVHGTHIRQLLRQIEAQQLAIGEADMATTLVATSESGAVVLSWEPVEGATSYNLFIATTAGVPAEEAQIIEGVESPYRHEGGAGETFYFKLGVVTEGGTEMTEEVSAVIGEAEETETPAEGEELSQPEQAVSLRLDNLSNSLTRKDRQILRLQKQLDDIERANSERDKRQALRSYRRSGHLSGSLKEMAKDFDEVPVEHINIVLRHVTPSEPRFPGVVLSKADGSDEEPANKIRSRADIHSQALRISKDTGRDVNEVRRELVNSLAPPSARPQAAGGYRT